MVRRFLSTAWLVLGMGALSLAGCQPPGWSVSLPFDRSPAHSVPRVEPNYEQTPEQWWMAHPLNPSSPNGIPIGKVGNPSPTIRLSDGEKIQQAIDSLPADGGTIQLEPGEYEGFAIVGRSNVHVIAEHGAIIKSTLTLPQRTSGAPGTAEALGVAVKIYGCRQAAEWTDWTNFSSNYAQFNHLVQIRDPAAWECFTNRTSNIYLNNLTIDGGGSAAVGITAGAVRDIVFDKVTLQNFKDLKKGHPGLISMHMGADNIWCRGCHFIGEQRWAIYLDGCHGCGVIRSTIEGKFGSGGLLFLTNDDFSYDIDNDGSFSQQEMRDSKYIIIEDNQFNGFIHTTIALSGRDSLIRRNTVGAVYNFVFLPSRCSQKWSQVKDVVYYSYGHNIIENRIGSVVSDGALGIVRVAGDHGTQDCPTIGIRGDTAYQHIWGRAGRYTVVRNEVSNGPPGMPLISETPPVDGPSAVCGNRINGSLSEQNLAAACPG